MSYPKQGLKIEGVFIEIREEFLKYLSPTQGQDFKP